MKIDEIHFNHASDGAAHDAFNLRWNATAPRITAPEWTFNGTNEPAAYARKALAGGVTIKASVADGPAGATVEVRALDVWAEGGGAIGWLLRLAKWLLPLYFGGALGEVGRTKVTLDKTGNSDLVAFPLSSHRLDSTPVGAYHVSWLWQWKTPSGWVDIGESKHEIFVTYDLPTCPWQPIGTAADESQIPWVEALKNACQWAQGARTPREIATSITTAVNGLGEVAYTPENIYWDPYIREYELTGFLADLADGDPFEINCRACADGVATFANILGANLETGVFEQDDTTLFETRDILAVGADVDGWQRWRWSYHEVAWEDANTVFDACLRLDDDPDETSFFARLPLAMPFGPAAEPTSYLYQLVGPNFVVRTERRGRKRVS